MTRGQGGGHGPDGKGNLWDWVVVAWNDKIISLRISFIDICDFKHLTFVIQTRVNDRGGSPL